MLLGIDPGLEGEPGRKGDHDQEVPGLLDDALGRGKLLVDDIAEDAALLVVVVGFGAVQLFLHELRDDRRGDDLRMGVVQRGTCGPALVLEDQHIAQAAVALQVQDPVAVGPEHFFHLAFGQLFEPDGMLRGFR